MPTTPPADTEPIPDPHPGSAKTKTTLHAVDDGGPDKSADCLIILSGDEPGRRIYLDAGVVIGRGEDCDEIVLDVGISRRHIAVHRRSGGRYVLTDLDSRNGTQVNGHPVQEAPLEYGDEIAIGANTVLTLARRDRFEDRFQVAQKMQALGQLAGGVSHDFNNLLGALFANITFLGTKQYDAQTNQCLAEMEAAVRRAVDLTRQLSEFGRRSVSKQSPVDLRDLVHEAVDLLRRTFPRNIELVTKVPRELTTLGDASRLMQVVMNLSLNAKDAMPQGGTLTIDGRVLVLSDHQDHAHPSLPGGTYVGLSFHDTGTGIDAKTLPRIFEPFFTTKPRGKGTGLGLATVQAIVRAHGGSIEVRSGDGTCFELCLPSAATTRVETVVGDVPAEIEPSIGGVVLVADDDDLVRTAIARAIRDAGAEVVDATDGGEALRRYAERSSEIRLIVLDLDMPRIDGAGVLRVLRSFDCDLPVLVVSGHNDPERIRELRALGISEFLAKPFAIQPLLDAVRRNLLRS